MTAAIMLQLPSKGENGNDDIFRDDHRDRKAGMG